MNDNGIKSALPEKVMAMLTQQNFCYGKSSNPFGNISNI